MISERLEELANAAGGKLINGKPDLLIKGLFSDTRAPLAGGMFVALRGDNFDGNRFAREAIEKHGAAAVLLDRPDAAKELPKGAGAILVGDTREGYLGIASSHRKKLSTKLWYGVTGSVGKSTTKEMLAHILESGAGLRIHKAKGSFNNAVGLSHTILGMSETQQAAVLEIGTNHPGEIRQLAAVARPNVAVITCAAESHLEAFHTVENVAREKGEILAFQEAQDVAILNADSPYLPLWKRMARGKVLTFGLSTNALIHAKYIRVNEAGCAAFMVRCGDEIADCVLRVPGLHQVSNALAAMAAGMAGGMTLAATARAMNTFEGVARRFAVRTLHGITLIDDAYNANPASFSAALETLKAMHATRRFVVAGDMLELGEASGAQHLELGRRLAECNLRGLITVGELASVAGAAAVGNGLSRANWMPCATPEAAGAALKPILREGDVVLVKGSHSIHLENCCAILEA
jgi:UDP-N-acetylmuramoyl-tripeptide--D-alanyl-D-alanine ligase